MPLPADAEEYLEKLKEVEGIASPVIARVYDRSGGVPGGDEEHLEDHDEL